MRTELRLPLGILYAFLLVLFRVAGAILFVPLPGFGSAPSVARAVFAVALTLCLFPAWPHLAILGPVPLDRLAGWAASESAFGVLVGVTVGFIVEGFQLAAQLINLQAGYSYVSAVDPNSEADSTVLQVAMQLASSLLFFSLGLDRQVIRVLADSLQWFPAGSFWPSFRLGDGLVRLGSGMFLTGVKLAMPVVALVILVDLAMALFGRMQAQLQLLSLAFPLKMLAAIALLAALAPLLPAALESAAGRSLEILLGMLRS